MNLDNRNNMKTNYIIILDFSDGEVIRIKLTEEQMQEAERHNDFEDYLETLEEKVWFQNEGLSMDGYRNLL